MDSEPIRARGIIVKYTRMYVAIYLRYFKEYVFVRVALLRLYNTHLQLS